METLAAVKAFILDHTTTIPPEPVFPLTAIPEGLGAPITPDIIGAVCDEALAMGDSPNGWPWRLYRGDFRDARTRPILAIPVMHRWKIGAPHELWPAAGNCRNYPAAFLADYTLLFHDRGGEEREAKRRPAQPTGWRAGWERWFPSSRNPVLRPQDRAFTSPPPAYFKIPDGGGAWAEPNTHKADDTTPEII